MDSLLSVHSPRRLPEPLLGLAELAIDLAWSWNHGGDRLWQGIDAELWERTGNPWAILQLVSHRRLEQLADDPQFLGWLGEELKARQDARMGSAWYTSLANSEPLDRVAYFSMEFGLSEALPLYSGGLGVLAGDTLKTASDLGVPLIGIGLLYQRGYFRQAISATNEQLEYYPYNPPSMLPVRPLRDPSGEWVHITIPLPGRELIVRGWQVQVGRVPLCLLDTNDPANSPRDRGITGELYGGDHETRLMQELVLGIGGWLLLEALGEGKNISVCHLNEGHAAFASVAHAGALAKRLGISYEAALTAVRAGTLFTTHTPVEAAFDRFPRELVEEYLQPVADFYGIPINSLLELGKESDSNSSFNMAWMALRTAGSINGVSRLHARVSRHLFATLFPRLPVPEVPVGVVTNGVHTPTWDSPEADRLWTECCGKERWRQELAGVEENVSRHDDEAIWSMRAANRRRLVEQALVREHQARLQKGDGIAAKLRPAYALDSDTLTLGFARRFTAYKRPSLLLTDPGRLSRLLKDPFKPVQLIVAGKAHPKDDEGKRLIQQWLEFLESQESGGRVVFLEDYDLAVASELVRGVDLWINTPRRPWEASGTSGMKVLVNGGLNISELDGWWAEAYQPDIGWSIGDGQEHPNEEENDRREADAMYQLLETRIIPEFYQRDECGIPRQWVARIRTSMSRLTPMYSTNRMLREYIDAYYHPMAKNFALRVADGGSGALRVNEMVERLYEYWPRLRLGEPQYQSTDVDELEVHVQVFLGGLETDEVEIELYAEPLVRGDAPELITANVVDPLVGTTAGYTYKARFATGRQISDYVLRARPSGKYCLWPLECPLILWQK